MSKTRIRILSAEINNFKNIEYGKIDFACNINKNSIENKVDILGIYGQNGSGKSAFINLLSLLKNIMLGERLPEDIKKYISQNSDSCKFVFDFILEIEEKIFKVTYEVILKQRETKDGFGENVINFMIFDKNNINNPNPIILSKEKLSYSQYEDSKWKRKKDILNFDLEKNVVFSPKSVLEDIMKKDENMLNDLRVDKKLAEINATSYIFNSYSYNRFLKHSSNKEHKDIIFALHNFAIYKFFIIENSHSGFINSNFALPLNVRLLGSPQGSIGTIPILLDGPSEFHEEIFSKITHAISTINEVLPQIIPDLTIEVEELGTSMVKNDSNEKGHEIRFELYSKRKGEIIPLRYESDGIKKIISILHMLIAMYNDDSLTLAIDELDSGIFEYLLGEILSIIQESGKGQLIFTSHNLRPLEKLNKKNILFTTANPKNRYIRLINVKANNNLRDVYYHDIVLGGQKEELYEATKSSRISRAFRLAGKN